MLWKPLSLTIASLTLLACTKESPASPASSAPAAETRAATQTLEAACAGCVFEMQGAKGCELAVKVGGKPYLVSGVPMPGHESGLCERTVMADVAGKLEGDRFVATSFALKP